MKKELAKANRRNVKIRAVILVINIVISQIEIPIQSSRQVLDFRLVWWVQNVGW